VKDQQILDDKGTVLIDLPFRERLSWTDRSLVARSPDGRTLAAGVGYFVELADLDTGRWRAGPVHHRRAEVLATSPEGGSVLSGDASGLRVLWRRNADPVVLPDPTWPHREPDRDPWLASGVGPRVPHSAAFSPDGQRLVSTFNGGVFTVHDGSTGAERWVGNADPKTLDGPHYRFDVVPAYRGPSCMTGEKRYLSAPTFTPDGRRLITAGAHDGKSAVLVWDADLGTVQHRFLFDSTALLEGFRADGRLQVLAGDTLFALHVGPGDGDPEVIANDVRSAWLDGGELKWIANGEDARAMYRVRPQVPAPSAPRLEEGRVVFPAP
jgi:WD40 repeat protein